MMKTLVAFEDHNRRAKINRRRLRKRRKRNLPLSRLGSWQNSQIALEESCSSSLSLLMQQYQGEMRSGRSILSKGIKLSVSEIKAVNKSSSSDYLILYV